MTPHTPDDDTVLRDELDGDDAPRITRARAFLWIAAVGVLVVASLVIVSMIAGAGPKRSEKIKLPDAVTEQPSDTGGRTKCKPEDLRVSAHTDALTYKQGVKPKFSLSVENTGASECVADLGTATMTFEVRPANEADAAKAVWRSTDCQTKADHRYVVLAPKTPLATEPLEWDRTASAKDTCEKTRPGVDQGAYDLYVAIGGAKAKEPSQFLLAQ